MGVVWMSIAIGDRRIKSNTVEHGSGHPFLLAGYSFHLPVCVLEAF
jgi:hypothetical protein